MTHAPETGAINQLHFFWRRFLVRVSRKNWYRIHLVPDSGAD